MSAYRAGKPSWADPGFYPVTERLFDGFDSSVSDLLPVDVGGGMGHDLVELKEKYPKLPGKLILQDRLSTVGHRVDCDMGTFLQYGPTLV